MRTYLLAAVAAIFFANNALAASCTEMAAEKKLAGAAKSSFMKKCEADTKAAAPAADAKPAESHAACAEKAAEKKLAGAAKSSFMKKCEADAKAATPNPGHAACAEKAAEKKLAGAAKSSFMKKCEADAKK